MAFIDKLKKKLFNQEFVIYVVFGINNISQYSIILFDETSIKPFVSNTVADIIIFLLPIKFGC